MIFHMTKMYFISFTASLDDVGFNFIKRCICAIEERGRLRLSLSLLAATLSSADNLRKQFEPRSGPTECQS